jgi:Fur family ferric uptake transcriptional regulator
MGDAALVIDADGHVMEPEDCWSARMDAERWGDWIPRREIEDGLDRTLRIDRVTVYRVLKWLTRQHLTHKISSDDRIWRYNAAPSKHDTHHAHFKCTACGEVICLQELSAEIRPRLPDGYSPEIMEVTIKGLCSECSPPRSGTPRTVRATTDSGKGTHER